LDFPHISATEFPPCHRSSIHTTANLAHFASFPSQKGKLWYSDASEIQCVTYKRKDGLCGLRNDKVYKITVFLGIGFVSYV